MHRPLFTLALLMILLAPAYAQDWTAISVTSSGTLRALEKDFAPGYVVGDGGFVAQTTSVAPTVWTTIPVSATDDLYSVIQPSFGQAWVSGANGTVRVRDNTGTWNVRDLPSAETFRLFTRSSGWALAAGDGGTIWTSQDLGLSWTQRYSGATPLRAGTGGFFEAWAVGDGGTILKGTTNGTVWTPVASGTTRDLHAVRLGASVPATRMAVGEAGTILVSTDGGATWTPRLSGTSRTLRDISTSGSTASWMIAVGDDGVVLRSENNGATWCRLTTGVTDDLHAAVMVSNSQYFVAGENGTLLRTTTSGGTCVLGIDATATRIGNGSIPAGGGPAQFTVELANPSPETQTFEAWVDAVLPGGSTFGPLLGPQTLTFAPGQSVGPITFTQSVPAAAPPGNYQVRLRAGDFATGALFDESILFYSKSGALAAPPASASADWNTQQTFLNASDAPVAHAQGSEAPSRLSEVRPNPVRDRAEVALTLEEAQAVTAEVFDALGRRVAVAFQGEVAAGRSVTVPLDVHGLSPGVYVVRVTGAAFVESRRFVVVR